MKLTHNNYGSANGFTISQSLPDFLGITNGTYAGVNVAGTINGEAATGAGQHLTGNSGQANVDGLKLRITLTAAQLSSQGAAQGTVTTTLGVAEQMARRLKAVTESFTGIASVRIDSLQDTTENIDKQITDMEVRLTQRRDQLTRQFVKLEVALSRLQTQSLQLNSRLSLLSSLGNSNRR
ncbi:MAG: flagellar filament capping protein FliD [Deltaproteobacteria bacterium]|nr:flagellar filament capping protein FliD [Deltaproteobacteria bacterium]